MLSHLSKKVLLHHSVHHFLRPVAKRRYWVQPKPLFRQLRPYDRTLNERAFCSHSLPNEFSLLWVHGILGAYYQPLPNARVLVGGLVAAASATRAASQIVSVTESVPNPSFTGRMSAPLLGEGDRPAKPQL